MKEFVCDDAECFVGYFDRRKFFNTQERSTIVKSFIDGIHAVSNEVFCGVHMREGQVIGKRINLSATVYFC